MLNSPICVDASFVMRLIGSDRPDTPAMQLWETWQEEARTLVAPTLLFYEITNALHRYTAHGELLPEEAKDLLHLAFRLGIILYGDEHLHTAALELASRLSLPATYDAHYLAVAQRLRAEFWAADRRLANAVRHRLPWVHLLPSL